jgi:hypothetical protein
MRVTEIRRAALSLFVPIMPNNPPLLGRPDVNTAATT